MAKKKRERGWPPVPEPLPGAVIDNHSHLDMVQTWDAGGWDTTDPSMRPTLTDHLARAAEVGVTGVVQVGCEVPGIAWTDLLLRSHGEIAGVRLRGAVAIHPNEAVLHQGVEEIAPDGLSPQFAPHHEITLPDAVSEVARIASTNPRIRAIGETGLDYFRAGERGREVQRRAFRDHIALAKDLGLALQIHDRDAHADVIDILDADGAPERTVFHCYSGDAAMARLCAERGWYLSIAGPSTFRANEAGRAAIAVTPLDLLLVETDAPFLTPHPDRGRPNSPYLIAATLREIARVQQRPVESVCAAITATSNEIYGPW